MSRLFQVLTFDGATVALEVHRVVIVTLQICGAVVIRFAHICKKMIFKSASKQQENLWPHTCIVSMNCKVYDFTGTHECWFYGTFDHELFKSMTSKHHLHRGTQRLCTLSHQYPGWQSVHCWQAAAIKRVQRSFNPSSLWLWKLLTLV